MARIRKAKLSDVPTIATMVANLLRELGGISVEAQDSRFVMECLNNESYNVFLAFSNDDACIGILSVSESTAIYAGGRFGTIQELYAFPEKRTLHIGHELIGTVVEYGVKQQWKRIEVGAPSPSNRQRTVDFYIREGFNAIGPRLKMVL